MEGIVFYVVVTAGLALLQFLISAAIAYQWLDGEIGFVSNLWAVMFLSMAGTVLKMAGVLQETEGNIGQQYAHLDMSDLIEQGQMWQYIGDMATTTLGMPAIIGAFVINLIIWVLFNHLGTILVWSEQVTEKIRSPFR